MVTRTTLGRGPAAAGLAAGRDDEHPGSSAVSARTAAPPPRPRYMLRKVTKGRSWRQPGPSRPGKEFDRSQTEGIESSNSYLLLAIYRLADQTASKPPSRSRFPEDVRALIGRLSRRR